MGRPESSDWNPRSNQPPPNQQTNEESFPHDHQSKPGGTQTLEKHDRDSNSEADEQGDRASKGSKRIWLIVLGAIALIGIGYGAWRWWEGRQSGEQTEQQSSQALPVELSDVNISTVESTSEFTGTLEADKSVAVQPQQSGEIRQILVEEGQRVSAGTALVQLGSTREEADVQAAQAQVDVAQAARASASANIESLRAEREQALADLELQREQIDRTAYLVEEGAIAQEDLDIRSRDLQSARAGVNVINRDIDAAVAQLNEADATLRQRRANLQRIREDLQDTTVNAPFSGTISQIPVETGDYVDAGQTLTNIVANQTLELNINIPQERIPDLRLGLPVRIEDAQGDRLATGQVSFIAPQVNTDSQLIPVKATFSNPGGLLRDGQFVRAVVIWEQRPDRVVVPQTAVIYRGDNRFVYIPQQQDGQMIATRQPVQLGLEQGTQVEVTQGLEPSDRIIASGIQRLSDGAPIRQLEDSRSNE